jgi:hypothetical protein
VPGRHDQTVRLEVLVLQESGDFEGNGCSEAMSEECPLWSRALSKFTGNGGRDLASECCHGPWHRLGYPVLAAGILDAEEFDPFGCDRYPPSEIA